MCGITGWIDWKVDLTRQQRVVEAMAKTLAFRGPDAAGIWLSPHAALGHRRLIVVDPAGGGQPMIRRRGEQEYIISYNGELYNTPELRQELADRGYVFQGHSDTEVLLLSFMEWGPDCVRRLNGIFAFAIWDTANRRLFMARDRLGVKPLFYTQLDSGFLFASELKTLLAHPLVKPHLDKEGLAEILVLGPGRTPGHGVFCGVKELRSGYSLIYDHRGVHLSRYWNLKSKPHEDDLATTISKVRELFLDTIQRQLVADVPVCTLLSGGLDSSAITAVAANHLQATKGEPLHTYSIDYEGNDCHFQPNSFQPNSDTPWVNQVSKYFGTIHHSVIINTKQLVESLIPAVLARDLPGMADVDSSLYLFCCEIKKESTVALSGECADEIFGGYPWFHNPETIAGDNFPWVRLLNERMKLFSPDVVKQIKPEEYQARRYRETLEEVPHLAGEDSHKARLREMFYLNFHWFMATLLDRKDRMSMATGLEVRVPFCDHRLVEYVWNIPWAMKTCGGMEKGILRRALKGILPQGVLERRKSPYPKTHNPAYLTAVRHRVLEILHDPSSPLLPLINKRALLNLANSHDPVFPQPWYGQLMTDAQFFAYLIQLDAWLRHYKVTI
ncbi:MAG: asparagine synthase (glutamine-hydrolyzing) [Clostridia bacterium]|nr:asparagine synthase (glutamine-hydrolyzing) [Clostridia bacterium]